jgi:acetyltransferase (GNAT) family protein
MLIRASEQYWLLLRDRLRYDGAWAAWWVLTRCARPLGHLELAFLYEMDLVPPVPAARARVPVELAHATTADATEIAGLMVAGDSGAVPDLAGAIARRLARGEICFVAKIGAQIVHCNWISFGWKESLAGRVIILSKDAAYCGGAYTAEGWRGQAIHTEVNAAMLRFLRDKDFRRAHTFVHADNRSSRKTMERLGWKRSGVMAVFTAKRASEARIWRLSGTLEPFVGQRVPG